MKKNLYLIPLAIAGILGCLLQPDKLRGASPEFMNPGWLTRVRTVSAGGGCTVTTNAITISLVAGALDGVTSNANSYWHPAFTPSAAGNTIAVIASFSPNVNTASISNTGTYQLSWWLAGITQTNAFATNVYNSGAQTLAIWISQLPPGVSPFSMRPVLTTSSGTGCNMAVLDITGADTNLLWGQNAIHQVAKGASNGVANPRLTWAAPGNNGQNAMIMAVADNINNNADAVAGTGFTELTELAYNTPATGLFIQYQLQIPAATTFGTNGQDNTHNWGGLAVEIRAGTNACGAYNDPLSLPAGISQFYVDTASTAGGTGTISNDTSTANRAFASLKEALEHTNLDTNNYRVVWCKGSVIDTNPVQQTTWNSISTTPTTRLFIIGDNITGTNNPNSYKIAITNENGIYNNQPGHVELRNIWVIGHITTSVGNSMTLLRLATANVGSGRTDCDCRLVNCGAVMTAAGGATDDIVGFYDSDFAVIDVRNRVRRINCIAYGGTYGFGAAATYPYFVENYNCTSVSNEFNFIDEQLIVDCLGAYPTVGNSFESVGVGRGFSGWNSTTDTSLSHKMSLNSQTPTFIGGKNFHIQTSDTSSKNKGIGNPTSILFHTDVDGQARDRSSIFDIWDIGYDEFQ